MSSSSSAGYADWETFTVEQWNKFTCDEWAGFRCLEESSSSSGPESCDLLIRRFTNTVDNGLSQDEVVGVYDSGKIPNVYNEAYYALRIPRSKDACGELFSRYPVIDAIIAHEYIFDRTSFPVFVINAINDNDNRLIEVISSDVANFNVYNQLTSEYVLFDTALSYAFDSSSSSLSSSSSA